MSIITEKSKSLLEAIARTTDLAVEASTAIDAVFNAARTMEDNCSFYSWLLDEDEMTVLQTMNERLKSARSSISEAVGLARRLEASESNLRVPLAIKPIEQTQSMSTAPLDRPFLARFSEIAPDRERLLRGILPSTVFCRARPASSPTLYHKDVADLYRWEVRGSPVYWRDSEFDGWAELPEGFTDISFPES